MDIVLWMVKDRSRRPPVVDADEALGLVGSNMTVFIHTAAAAPLLLIQALTRRAYELDSLTITHLHTDGPAPYVEESLRDRVKVRSLFVGSNIRESVTNGASEYVPVFLSEIPSMFRDGSLPIDVALVQVSPPDRHGWCTLGVSVDVTRAAVDSAEIVIGQLNSRMPRCHGDGLVHLSDFDAIVEADAELFEPSQSPLTDAEVAIGVNVASLVPDGATLQMGIGAIPDAVLHQLCDHRRLGIHTETFSDGVVDLVESGAITGEEKVHEPGIIVAGFVAGTRRLYDFVDDNPGVRLLDIGYVNDTAVIRNNPKVIAVNSAIEVDITGQVVGDSIGIRQYSGVGGQMDFMRGASLSNGGKPIIALPSVTSKGTSRIVGLLQPGASVTTTRSHVHYVVTEHGIAELRGASLQERARRMIAIAAPDHRDSLDRAARERFGTAWSRIR